MYISNEQCQNRNSKNCLLAEYIFAGTNFDRATARRSKKSVISWHVYCEIRARESGKPEVFRTFARRRIAINDKGRHLEGEHMDKPVALGEVTLGEGVDSWNTIIFLYNSALKEVRTKVEILNDEFQQVHQYNPIEYIKSQHQSAGEHCQKVKAVWL